ncbi:hypothetical protein G9C98_000817 [Cotesia typhae]|uniref:Uncharacterized protein n=1 Tax=Cotesia typhae TaxID=2053667 RepID=A0A8J5USV2_9HYME|nr:hypothetical protein G9C98_000817 [Cotesia typhae]
MTSIYLVMFFVLMSPCTVLRSLLPEPGKHRVFVQRLLDRQSFSVPEVIVDHSGPYRGLMPIFSWLPEAFRPPGILVALEWGLPVTRLPWVPSGPNLP